MKLTSVCDLTMNIVRTRHLSVPHAAVIALRQSGYSNPKQTLRVTRIVNDVNADESLSLVSAITSELGARSAAVRRQIMIVF